MFEETLKTFNMNHNTFLGSQQRLKLSAGHLAWKHSIDMAVRKLLCSEGKANVVTCLRLSHGFRQGGLTGAWRACQYSHLVLGKSMVRLSEKPMPRKSHYPTDSGPDSLQSNVGVFADDL